MTVLDFPAYKKEGKKISMITCYDASFARIVGASNVDCILIGDSGTMTMRGFATTVCGTMQLMLDYTASVRAGTDKFIVADMPFLATRKSLADTVESAGALLSAGANAVKIERIDTQADTIKYLVDSGIPVMAHLGLTPQFFNAMGGHKKQGKSEAEAERIYNEALLAEKCGCFSVVLECIPSELAGRITKALTVPTIGIGSGRDVDGQVLVLQDALGMTQNAPKFAHKFMDGWNLVLSALNDYDKDTKGLSGQARQ